uniref:DUF1685 family protein n=1 Tax=Cajanus cajan TaxID=3821 RepID=A0A151TL50_CAJCA|nr:hypothetical protein KK1_024101 [Cajanus cajan]
MAAEQVLRLLDSFWFETSILTNRNNNQTPSNQDSHNNLEKVIPLDDAKFVLVPTPTLEVREFSCEKREEIKIERKERGFGHGRRRVRKGRTTRSLSELEFKELKGFMDLGFVFSEEDKDSRLVSLIPGLQRLGRGEEVEGKGDDYESVAFDKPYLSEAWDVLDQRGTGNDPLMDWRVPVRGNEIDMKDNLRFWAHTVASIVR